MLGTLITGNNKKGRKNFFERKKVLKRIKKLNSRTRTIREVATIFDELTTISNNQYFFGENANLNP